MSFPAFQPFCQNNLLKNYNFFKLQNTHKMATILFPSSFRCDCGEEQHFGENTIKEIKKMSQKKPVRLDDGKHVIVFDRGNPIEIFCPELGSCPITDIEHI